MIQTVKLLQRRRKVQQEALSQDLDPRSRRGLSSAAWAQLLQTMCLPDWLPACGPLWLADRRLGLCEGFAAFCCGQGQPGEMPSDLQSNGTVTPE